MTFGNMNGFLIDFIGPAGDLMNGMTDNYHDPCPGVRVTVGVGERVPVVVRAAGVPVTVTNPQTQRQPVTSNTVQVTAQAVSVTIAQPGGASNPIRQDQPQSATQPQTIAVVPADRAALSEFAQGNQRAGVTLLVPKILAEGKQANSVVNELGKQIAVEVAASRETAQLLNQADDVVLQQLANQLRNNQGNLQQILQKAGVGFDDINNIKNSMFSSNNTALQAALQKISDKLPQVTKTLQTAASNIAVRACG